VTHGSVKFQYFVFARKGLGCGTEWDLCFNSGFWSPLDRNLGIGLGKGGGGGAVKESKYINVKLSSSTFESFENWHISLFIA